jgi:hypothetical protein
MKKLLSNRITLNELEQIEEAAHHAQSLAPESVLRLTAVLREALQVKANERALCPKCHQSLSRNELEVTIDCEVRKCQD